MTMLLDPTLSGRTLDYILERQWGLTLRCLACQASEGRSPAEIVADVRKRVDGLVSDYAAGLFCKACGSQEIKVTPRQFTVFSSMNHEGAAGRRAAYEAWLARLSSDDRPAGT